MRYIGIDLAWGENARTGMAELDSHGRLISSASVRTDGEIASFVGPMGPGLVAAIDAPLIVANESGQRPCEREVGRLFSRFHASAHSSNRGNPMFNPETRGARLARQFGWQLDPSVRPQSDRSVAIEVYPHPAMVSLFGLDRVIPYKGKKGRDVPARQRAFESLFGAMEETCGPRLHLDSSDRWQQLREDVAAAPRQVDLNTVEDEVDAIFCAYLAWLWTSDAGSMTVLGDVSEGYIVTPHPPTSDEARHYVNRVDEAGATEVRFGDGVPGERLPSDSVVPTSYRTGGGAAGNVAAPVNPSAISRLLDEISWEGNAKKYRDGGRHLENVMTAEVFSALDYLPRTHFLAPVLMDAQGADEARAAAASQVEQAIVDILPGDLAPTWRSGELAGWRIQPDVLIPSPGSLVYVEAKAISGGKFSTRQVARSLHATLDEAGERAAVLLLVLDAPPPLSVKGHGRQSLRDALELGLHAFPDEDAQQLRDVFDETVAWTTWDLIAGSLRGSLSAFTNPDPSVLGGVRRITLTAEGAIHATQRSGRLGTPASLL